MMTNGKNQFLPTETESIYATNKMTIHSHNECVQQLSTIKSIKDSWILNME